MNNTNKKVDFLLLFLNDFTKKKKKKEFFSFSFF